MWIKVMVNNSEFMVQHIITESTHKILLTDMVQMWSEIIEERDLLLRCKNQLSELLSVAATSNSKIHINYKTKLSEGKEMNKLVEADDEVFLGHVLSLLKNEKTDIYRSLNDTENGKTFHIHASLEGFKFKIKFLLKSVSSYQFFEEITLPFLTVVSELEKRQKMLVDIIKSKDLEILEYKLEGGQISRKAVETDPFDVDAFTLKCSEELSNTKTCIHGNPTHVLTTTLQDLLLKMANTPVLPKKEPVEVKPSKSNSVARLKSPVKHKRLKMIEDDEDDDNTENNYIKREIKKEPQDEVSTILQSKEKKKIKTQKILPNL